MGCRGRLRMTTPNGSAREAASPDSPVVWEAIRRARPGRRRRRQRRQQCSVGGAAWRGRRGRSRASVSAVHGSARRAGRAWVARAPPLSLCSSLWIAQARREGEAPCCCQGWRQGWGRRWWCSRWRAAAMARPPSPASPPRAAAALRRRACSFQGASTPCSRAGAQTWSRAAGAPCPCAWVCAKGAEANRRSHSNHSRSSPTSRHRRRRDEPSRPRRALIPLPLSRPSSGRRCPLWRSWRGCGAY